MKKISFVILVLISTTVRAQRTQPEDFGFRHLKTLYKGDTVDILIKSKKGDELKQKPLFFFCQGSRPVPLIKKDGEKTYNVFPFKPDSLMEKYHIIILSKPYVPLVVDASTLTRDLVYEDPLTHKIPKKYSERNVLDYYVDRNIQVIDFLQKQSFISKTDLVVAGHSEGSTIAAKMALLSPKVSRLIYASGCPLGRIMAIIAQDRAAEVDNDSSRYTADEFNYWESIVDNKTSLDDTYGDTPKATYDFSIPPIQYLEQLKIPVLVAYGTKDGSAPFNDYLHVEMLRQKKNNFTFKDYIGLEHNFFPLTPTGRPDYNQFNWDKVALDWLSWMEEK